MNPNEASSSDSTLPRAFYVQGVTVLAPVDFLPRGVSYVQVVIVLEIRQVHVRPGFR